MSWENNIRRVEPYVPGEQPKENDIIKLNTNENPYPPCPGVRQVLNDFRSKVQTDYLCLLYTSPSPRD